MKRMKHVGLSAHRLSKEANNPREVAFSEQWKEENQGGAGGNLLQSLVPLADQRDATVAATIIQWLGSNVGMCFLLDVIMKSPDVQKLIIPTR